MTGGQQPMTVEYVSNFARDHDVIGLRPTATPHMLARATLIPGFRRCMTDRRNDQRALPLPVGQYEFSVISIGWAPDQAVKALVKRSAKSG
jgi:hypothetical protein